MLETTLLQLTENPSDTWTVDDAFKGVSIIGGTGSGKTSASGKTFALKYLEQGWGGLVLCAKSDEAELWKSYCKKTGREKDLILFGKNSVHPEGEEFAGQTMCFNAIHNETHRAGEGAGDTLNMANIFMNIYRMGNRISGEGDTKDEKYWDSALKRCLNRVIELLKIADEELTYLNMVKLLSSTDGLTLSKYEEEQAYYEEYNDHSRMEKQKNYCIKCISDAFYLTYKAKNASFEEDITFKLVYDYFLRNMPNMGEKHRPTIVEIFMSLSEPFLSGMLFRHFAGVTNIFPEWTYERNKIIVLDFGIKEFLDIGIIAQSIFKLMFQQCIERRDITKYPSPVFLWCDEAQYFLSEYDQIFLTTARSSRTAVVFLSQNIPNYYSAMGSKSDTRSRVDSLMGNLSTKIFHANSDAVTNEYASRLIGDEIGETENFGKQHKHFSFDTTLSEGVSRHYMPQVRPMEFTTLKSGGIRNNFEVESIIMVTGREWSDGKNHLRRLFIQDFK